MNVVVKWARNSSRVAHQSVFWKRKTNICRGVLHMSVMGSHYLNMLNSGISLRENSLAFRLMNFLSSWRKDEGGCCYGKARTGIWTPAGTAGKHNTRVANDDLLSFGFMIARSGYRRSTERRWLLFSCCFFLRFFGFCGLVLLAIEFTDADEQGSTQILFLFRIQGLEIGFSDNQGFMLSCGHSSPFFWA